MSALQRFKDGHIFYVGSSEIASGRANWPVTDLQSAIAKAEQKCEKEGAPQIVVAVVAVIEPERPPVRVTILPGLGIKRPRRTKRA